MKKIKVYIAGPYTNKNPRIRSENIKKAVEMGREILKMGHHPYVPHRHTGEWEDAHPFSYEEMMQLHFTFIEKWADAMFFMGSSPGADREKAMAKSLGIPVFHSIEEFQDFAAKAL
ncbi:DUF4406 domain-containing protein [Candidatus Woesearchaeota archaeon]|nr:DUF4406 domain-containing protein [Candidatus Woesearchaeota archaeon]